MLKATFAAGCFWGVEKSFRAIQGVGDAIVGYTGGWTENPTYSKVCGKKTGHAEAVLLTYDPNVVTYGQLLSKFWSIHDPTQVNGQGVDRGPQYRSAIFYHSPEQQQEAEASKADMARRLRDPIATEIVQASKFYTAEQYHQRYLEKQEKQ